MKKRTFTVQQIAQALHQVELETPVAGVCCRLGISEQTFYRWKKKLAVMSVAELRWLKQLEEDRKLKQLVADVSLDKHMLQEAIQESSAADPETCSGRFLMVGYTLNERLACSAVGINRSSHRYESTPKDQTALKCACIRDIAAARGIDRLPSHSRLLDREGWKVNHK